MLMKHARKGRLVYVSGKMQTRRWRKDGEDSDRFATEILLVPGSRVQFLEKANGSVAAQAAPPDADAAASANGAAMPAGGIDNPDDIIPF